MGLESRTVFFCPQHYKLPSEIREKYPHLNLALCNCPCTFIWFSICLQWVSISGCFKLDLFGIFKARHLERKALGLKRLNAQLKYLLTVAEAMPRQN